MLFDMENPSGFDPYSVLTRLIVPRPIAWVSSVSKEGVFNLAPFSFFNLICDEPPIVILSISRKDDGCRKDTAENILHTGDFVINLVSVEHVQKVMLTSEEFPPEVDEFKVAGLTPTKAHKVKSPRVAEAKAWLECVFLKQEELFGYDLIFGRVVLVGAESLDYKVLKPVGRLSESFCELIEINQEK